MFRERIGLVIWVKDVKPTKSLEKYGLIHYVSSKMKYVVLYVNKEHVDSIQRNIQRYHFVRKVEYSYRKEIKTDYDNTLPDKTRYYSI